MFGRFRPSPHLLYEHVFCPTVISALTQRARGALSLSRSFLLLEDDDPVDWEVDQEDRGRVCEEPLWATAHRAPLRERRVARRGGQTPARAQICLCPIDRRPPAARINYASDSGAAPCAAASARRGSSSTTGNSRVAIDL
jgi:hypothetical protein